MYNLYIGASTIGDDVVAVGVVCEKESKSLLDNCVIVTARGRDSTKVFESLAEKAMKYCDGSVTVNYRTRYVLEILTAFEKYKVKLFAVFRGVSDTYCDKVRDLANAIHVMQ